MANQPPTLQELAQAFNNLQIQFNNANRQITSLEAELSQTKTALQNAQHQITTKTKSPKQKLPEPFKGKTSIKSWTTHMNNYLANSSTEEALPIAISYLQGHAHEWWIMYKETEEGQRITNWTQLKEALTSRFETLNKEKIARDKLAKWKQLKDVSTFNDDFQNIILDIPNISIEEQIDRYTRGLKHYIWKELCTNEYEKLADAMRDAERVEAAHSRLQKTGKDTKKPANNRPEQQKPVPMDIGNVQLRKLTREERETCMKEGRCLRCREKGHMAKNCPKGQRN